MSSPSFARLRKEDAWGIRIPQPSSAKSGDTVSVHRRDGSQKQVVLGERIAEYEDASLFRIAADNGNGGHQQREQTISEPGVYQTPDGNVYVARPSKNSPGYWNAFEVLGLRDTQGARVNEDGEAIPVRLEYRRGKAFELTPEMRMDFEEAKRISQQVKHCICCGAKLEVRESIERGVGPVCAKAYFPNGVS